MTAYTIKLADMPDEVEFSDDWLDEMIRSSVARLECTNEELRLLRRTEGLIAENDRLREALKQIDDHMVLVPRAPTNDMLDAGLEEDTWSPLEIYRAMIAASQEPKL